MKNILLAIQTRLAAQVPELLYIDKDWGQLNYEQPPVQFPCALLDVSNADYTQFSSGVLQRARATIEVIIINRNLVPSSAASPRRAEAFVTLEIISKVHAALHQFSDTDRTFTPLVRTSLAKQRVETSAEAYIIYYQTMFTE
jgi:hypothetical protein